jgi:CSLREA domain-containing protein
MTDAAQPLAGLAPHRGWPVPTVTAPALPLALATLLLSGCFTVNSLVDLPDADPGDGVCARALTRAEVVAGRASNLCTLRAAVMEASASAFKATVTVPAGTYNLNLPVASGGGRLKVTSSLRLQGSGAGSTTIDQQVGDAVIHVQGGDDVEINHLTVQGGDSSAGGGIRIDAGTVEMEDLVIRDNFGFTGGGGLVVAEGATARLRRSTVSGNAATGAFGGGIWNLGTLWVYDSTISGNESNRAGGIRNSGNLNLRNVTVSGNWAHSPNAGVGGISQIGFAVLNNVTVTNNTGVGNVAGSFRGGGIQTSGGALTVMKNSIVAGNDGGTGPNDCVGTLTADSKYNLIGDSNGCTITSYLSTYLLNVPANLGLLAWNGGTTRTHLPLSTSAARNAGYGFPPPASDACEARDQRGVPRPQGSGGCDMGAVEYTPANLHVTGFVLVDAATDTDIRPLRNDDTLLLHQLPPQLSVRAVVSGSPGSVVFGFEGNAAYRTENAAPYTLGGDASGDYAAVSFSPGQQTLSATPFTGADGTAAAGGAMQIRFNVIDLSATTASTSLALQRQVLAAPGKAKAGPVVDLPGLCRSFDAGADLAELAARSRSLIGAAGLQGFAGLEDLPAPSPRSLRAMRPDIERSAGKWFASACRR